MQKQIINRSVLRKAMILKHLRAVEEFVCVCLEKAHHSQRLVFEWRSLDHLNGSSRIFPHHKKCVHMCMCICLCLCVSVCCWTLYVKVIISLICQDILSSPLSSMNSFLFLSLISDCFISVIMSLFLVCLEYFDFVL